MLRWQLKLNQFRLHLSGSVLNHTSITWSTDGDGHFDDENTLQTFYYPGKEDRRKALVTLSLTAFGNGTVCSSATDDLQVRFERCAVPDGQQSTTLVFPNPTQNILRINSGNELIKTF